jgi:transcriptional regulator with XRE-family HTH domain
MKKMKHIGEAFRFVRLSRALEQKDVAERAGISDSYMSSLELGRRDPTWTTVQKVCMALGVPVTFIMVLLEGAEPDVKPFVPAVSTELWNMTREVEHASHKERWSYP